MGVGVEPLYTPSFYLFLGLFPSISQRTRIFVGPIHRQDLCTLNFPLFCFIGKPLHYSDQYKRMGATASMDTASILTKKEAMAAAVLASIPRSVDDELRSIIEQTALNARPLASTPIHAHG